MAKNNSDYQREINPKPGSWNFASFVDNSIGLPKGEEPSQEVRSAHALQVILGATQSARVSESRERIESVEIGGIEFRLGDEPAHYQSDKLGGQSITADDKNVYDAFMRLVGATLKDAISEGLRYYIRGMIFSEDELGVQDQASVDSLIIDSLKLGDKNYEVVMFKDSGNNKYYCQLVQIGRVKGLDEVLRFDIFEKKESKIKHIGEYVGGK